MSAVNYYQGSEAQDAMAVVAKWIGQNYGLKVIYHDGSAVDADIFRGIIRIPKLACSGGITEEALMLLRGRVYHEAGHIRFTDSSKSEYPEGIHFQITNAVEDRREERCMSEDFAGAAPIFRAMMIYHNKKIAERAAEGSVGGVIWEALVAMSFQSEGIRPAWRLSEKAQKYFEAAYDKFCEWKSLKSAQGSVVLAKEILDILKQVHEEEKERQEQEQKEQESQEPEDSESSESDDDSESDESDEGEGSGEGSDGEGEESEGEESGEGDSEESEGDESGEGGSESSEAEEGEEGDDDEGEGSNGSEGEESESEEGSDSEGSDGEESEEGEGSSGSQGGDFDDEEDESEGSSASSGGDDFDDEEEDEEGESPESDGSDASESDGGEAEDGDQEGEPSASDDESDSDSYDSSDSPESGGSKPEEEKEERTEEEILEEMEEEMEGFSLEELSDEDIAAALESLDPKDKGYLAKRDDDEHIPMVGSDWDKTRYKEFLDKISSKVAGLTASLVQALRARSRCRKQGHQRRGRLDTGRLVAIAKNLSKEVFYKVKQGESLSTAISIVIDESSSMSNRTAGVRLVTIAICEALSQLNIPFEVVGTTTKYMGGYSGNAPALNGLDRTNPIQFRHYKDFGESWAVVRHSICKLSHYNHNIDGETVEYAARRLAARPESRKIVFSLCDGKPISGHGNNATMGQNLIRSCERARENGIEVYGIGVGTVEPAKYYGKDFFVYAPDTSIDDSFAKAFVEIVGGIHA